MPESRREDRQRKALEQRRKEYEEAKARLLTVGFVLQGSVTERWIQCGKAACRCHREVEARHGPYYQWSWKERGRTASTYLTPDQAEICRAWVQNHRHAEAVLKRMREISMRTARLYEIRPK